MIDIIISFVTFGAIGQILGSVGYGPGSWQFWVIILCMLINRISALLHD